MINPINDGELPEGLVLVVAGRLVALEGFGAAETVRRGGVDVVAAGRVVEVLVAGLAGDAVFAADVGAEATLLVGAAVVLGAAAADVVVVVFFAAVVAVVVVGGLEAGGLVAGALTGGFAAGAALETAGLGAGAADVAGVAFLKGDSLVGRAGLLLSVVAFASVVGARLEIANKKR